MSNHIIDAAMEDLTKIAEKVSSGKITEAEGQKISAYIWAQCGLSVIGMLNQYYELQLKSLKCQ